MLQPLAEGILRTYRALPPRRSFEIGAVCRKYKIEPRGLLHLGANHGQEAAAYQAAGFKSVLWIEGYPKFFAALAEHLRNFPGQEAREILISDIDNERVRFNISDNLASSSVFEPGKQWHEDFPHIHHVESEQLTARRLDTYFAETRTDLDGYNFLVADLEGSELKALRSMGSLIDGFEWAAIEISLTENFVAGARFQDVDAFMVEKGFRRIEAFMASSSGDALYHREPVGLMARTRMVSSAYWYTLGYYRIYRDTIVKGIKRLAS